MLKYKLVACDLDDTLLRQDFSVSEKNLQAIRRVQSLGTRFVIITGRITAAALPIIKSIGIQEPFATFQGASIVDYTTMEEWYRCDLERNQIVGILRYAEMHNIHVNIYDHEKIYVKALNQWTDLYQNYARNVEIVPVGSLQAYAFEKTPKMILVGEPEQLKKAEKAISEFIPSHVNMFYSKKNFLEFTNLNATKGHALAFLADKWGIDPWETMAIGDNFNDLSMIEYAGMGVCVENGEQGVKEKSQYITGTNENDGVAQVLEKFILS